MNGWISTDLGHIAIFKNGKSSPDRIESGKYSVYGSNGIIGYSDSINSKESTIIIGRVGSYCGSTYYSLEKCWVTDNAIIGKGLNENDTKFIYYLLLNLKLNKHKTGSGQTLLNQSI